MMVYLAGPIDLVGRDVAHDWRNGLARSLAAHGVSVYNPAAAFSFVPEKGDASKLVSINEHALKQCDLIFFRMDSNTPSIGTPIELYMAKMADKPILVYWESSGPLPAYVEALVPKECMLTKGEDAVQTILMKLSQIEPKTEFISRHI